MDDSRIDKIEKSSQLIGKAVVSSILITLISFSPILFLTGQEHKLFSPLVWTKTFAMIGSGFVAIMLVPVLMAIFLKGKVRPESKHPISRFFIWIYGPVIRWCLKWKKITLGLALALVLGSIPLVMNLGTEFMPPLDEGSFSSCPSRFLIFQIMNQKESYRYRTKLSSLFLKLKTFWEKLGVLIQQRIMLQSA